MTLAESESEPGARRSSTSTQAVNAPVTNAATSMTSLASSSPNHHAQPKAKKPKKKQVMLGICGGVGPAAGLLLHQLVLKNTDSAGEDQGHLNVCHFSRSQDMTDRTQYLVYAASSSADDVDDASSGTDGDHEPEEILENPACGMARTFAMMHAAATAGRARLVVGVPCNTFHAQPIWDEFMRRTGHARDVCHVHMLEETVVFITSQAPSCTRVGLMSTTGTRESRVYHDLLEPRGFTVVEVDDATQQELHESIYDRDWGVKSTAPAVSPRCETNFHRYASQLREQGAEVVILGCTEIPFVFAGKTHFAGALLINPMVALARAMIREAEPTRLKAVKYSAAQQQQQPSTKRIVGLSPIVPLGAAGLLSVPLKPLKYSVAVTGTASGVTKPAPSTGCSSTSVQRRCPASQ